MIYGWIIGKPVALDLEVKSVVESQKDDTSPRNLPFAKGFIKLHKDHNSGFPFGFIKERPELVKGVPLMVASAMVRALTIVIQDKGKTGEKLGLSLVMGDAFSSLYDRMAHGYAVGCFAIEWRSLRKVVLNLGGMSVSLGSVISVLAQTAGSLEDAGVKKKKK